MSFALFSQQTLLNTLADPQSVQSKKIISLMCQAILSNNTQHRQIQEYVKFIFKICFLKNNQSLLNFLLFRVPWFQTPYVKFLTLLQKTVRLYRGQGKQATIVGYNIFAQGLITNSTEEIIVDTICRLLQGRYDNQILLNTLQQNYPHKNRNIQAHQNYIRGLLQLCKKKQNLRSSILEIIIDHLSTIDTQIKIGDKELTQPYIKEKQFLLKRQQQDEMGLKLDQLLEILLQFLEIDDEAIAKELLMIFHKKVLITDKNKYIQYIIFYISEKSKKVSGYFLSLLSNNILDEKNESTYKQAYINNVFYLGSYLVRSSKCSLKKIEICLKDIFTYLKNEFDKKEEIADLSLINLHSIFQQNEYSLYLIQLILYVCTYRPRIMQILYSDLKDLLKNAQNKIYYEIFINRQIMKRFKHMNGQPFTIDTTCDWEYLKFENKFNPVLLTRLSVRIDPLFLFYKYDEIIDEIAIPKRKASLFLEKGCQKKIKKAEKDSHNSDQSTNFFKF